MARILISMKDNFLKSIDQMAQKEQRSRSELVREALREYIKKSRAIYSKDAQKNATILESLLDWFYLLNILEFQAVQALLVYYFYLS